ncbi:Centromere protein T [Acropora cervicornis]|uniref:Centromere protein T n=1 Tax=Acropora cervicornis TaxID=6130 RepID=A0AAD9PW37_ACRCE|nr:Centromere protein T [Acropora cervicornis]
MGEVTPRGMIRGVLSTASVSQSARNLRPRKTPRTANAEKIPGSRISHAGVANRILTRSRTRSASKRKARSSVQTPSDLTTPRTLITGYLQAAPVAASAVRFNEELKGKKVSSFTAEPSQEDNKTPRTIIQNFLREGLAETPIEPILSGGEDDNDSPQTVVSQTSSAAVSSIANALDDSVEIPVISTTTSNETTDVTMMEETASASGGESQNLGVAPSALSVQIETTDTSVSNNTVPTSRQWRELVTPQLPLNVPSSIGVDVSSLMISGTEGKSSGPKMPPSLVKSIFQHFSKTKVSKKAFQAVELGSNLFFKRQSSDLMMYCQHAHRSTIDLADVELLMKRQGFVTDRESLYSLVEKYLPLEYREEIIPTVQAGNKILLK